MDRIPQFAASLLRPYLAHARDVGVDVDQLLAEYGTNAQQIESNNYARVSEETLRSFIRHLVTATDDPFFGVNAAQHVQQDVYGLLGYMVFNSPNLYKSYAITQLYHQLANDVNVMQLHGDRPPFFLSCQTPPVVNNNDRQSVEYTVACWVLYCSRYVGLKNRPLAVHFRHDCPCSEEDVKKYNVVFGTDVLFGQERNGLLIGSELAYEPILQADARLLEMLMQRAGEQIKDLESDQKFSYLVKCAMADLLGSGPISRERVADRLHIGGRTLQRRLLDEGHSFNQLLTDVKQNLAVRLIDANELSLEEISFRVGFTEARSFQRAFKQWTGQTVGQYKLSR